MARQPEHVALSGREARNFLEALRIVGLSGYRDPHHRRVRDPIDRLSDFVVRARLFKIPLSA